jgi:hypothetical protein
MTQQKLTVAAGDDGLGRSAEERDDFFDGGVEDFKLRFADGRRRLPGILGCEGISVSADHAGEPGERTGPSARATIGRVAVLRVLGEFAEHQVRVRGRGEQLCRDGAVDALPRQRAN